MSLAEGSRPMSSQSVPCDTAILHLTNHLFNHCLDLKQRHEEAGGLQRARSQLAFCNAAIQYNLGGAVETDPPDHRTNELPMPSAHRLCAVMSPEYLFTGYTSFSLLWMFLFELRLSSPKFMFSKIKKNKKNSNFQQGQSIHSKRVAV